MLFRLFFLLFILSACSTSRKSSSGKNPPGTVQIDDTLFADKTEVGNIQWREYLYYLSGQKNEEAALIKALPDSTVWNSDTAHNPLSEYYFRHPSYNFYPVVGISYEQVINFCIWRTHQANLAAYLDEMKFENPLEHFKDSFPIKFIYRLPTKQEWEIIASGKLSVNKHPYGYDTTYRKWKGSFQHAFNSAYLNKNLNVGGREFYTAEVRTFYPNSLGCFNMIGNVAEMISEKGIAKGGSFIHPLDSCKILLNLQYTKPERWLGFRCVAVKIK